MTWKLTCALCFVSLAAAGQNLSVEMHLDRITVEDREFNFKPPVNVNVKLKSEKPSPILELAKTETDVFAVRFVYHISFIVVSPKGENPLWKKSKVLEIEFYKQDPVTRSWQWFYTSKELVGDKVGDKQFKINSFTYDDEKVRKQYRLRYEFRVR